MAYAHKTNGTAGRGIDSASQASTATHDMHSAAANPRAIAWDEWVPEDRAASHLGASTATLRRMRALGKLPFTTVAGHVYYHPDDLSRLLSDGYGRTA